MLRMGPLASDNISKPLVRALKYTPYIAKYECWDGGADSAFYFAVDLIHLNPLYGGLWMLSEARGPILSLGNQSHGLRKP